MTPETATVAVRLALPKGRMQASVETLLAEAGIEIQRGPRGYRPGLSVRGFETKILKPQNIVRMLAAGSRDLGFAGADWVRELQVELVELVDTGMDPVRIVAAAPPGLLGGGDLPRRPLVVASEYETLTTEWIEAQGLDATFLRSFGATEVFPPEDADVIVDNTATGATLRANGLEINAELMRSSTRLYANPRALEEPAKRDVIDRLVMLIESVLAARRRVMIEVNVPADRLEAVVAVLPGMGEPTISPLHGNAGFGVKAAIPRSELPRIVPLVKECGGTDIVVTKVAQILP